MKHRMYVIVNPASAGKATGKEWPEFERLLKEQGYDFVVKYTEYHEHATEITRAALKEGYDFIVSVGGDGTMNEVVNGFFENQRIINPEAKLAVFSRGTGCDFIRSMGVKKGFEDFLGLLQRDTCKKLDLGRVTFMDYTKGLSSRYFLNISDIGIGGDTTNRVNKTSKALKGFLSFMIGAMISILFYRNKHFTVTIDGKKLLDERLNSVIVANGRYFGGGMEVAPKAKLDDGIFDVVILGNLNTLELIRSFPLIYKGEHLKHPKVKLYHGKSVSVQCKTTALVDVDGEQPGTTDAEFQILPAAINVLV